ncbi:MAG: hypothetical protein WKF84_23725 [Pyrinomonadaceae bacterium]
MSAEEAREISVHAARTTLNRDSQIKAWAETWVMEQERGKLYGEPGSEGGGV